MKWLEFIKGAGEGLGRNRHRTHGKLDKATMEPSLALQKRQNAR
jgi:hypothetical protein